jgi:putative membrane protein
MGGGYAGYYLYVNKPTPFGDLNLKSYSENLNRTFKDYLVLSAKGFCMGASDVVPGVSGGTMAFILGIYDELIYAIRSFDLKCLQLFFTLKPRDLLNRISWQFLLAIVIGILTAVFSLARVLAWLLENRPVLIWSFFFGLVLASVLIVSRRIGQWKPKILVLLAGGIIGTYYLVGLVPVSTPNAWWFLLLSGGVAICAMILPGISGSFILVLLGKYKYVLDAVNQRDFLVLLLVGSGAVLGIVAFSRILGWFLKRYHDPTVAVLTGLMLGSLRKVWPWKETVETITDAHGYIVPLLQSNVLPGQWNMEVTVAIALMALGIMVVLILDHLANKKKPPL